MQTSILIIVVCLLSVALADTWITYDQLHGKPFSVSYDKRAITINNKRVMLLAGVVHYARSTPAMWRGYHSTLN